MVFVFCTSCSCWCVCVFSHMGFIFVAHTCYSLRFFCSLCDPHPPTYTHSPTLQGFFADAHRFKLKCWVVGGVGWTTVRDSPCESDLILVIQVRVIINCLLILFITQSGSCTLRRPRLLCCFPLHRRQNSSDIMSSFTSFVDRHENTNSWRTNMATEEVGVQFRQNSV